MMFGNTGAEITGPNLYLQCYKSLSMNPIWIQWEQIQSQNGISPHFIESTKVFVVEKLLHFLGFPKEQLDHINFDFFNTTLNRVMLNQLSTTPNFKYGARSPQ